MTPCPAPRGGTKRKSAEAHTPVLQQAQINPEISGGIFIFLFYLGQCNILLIWRFYIFLIFYPPPLIFLNISLEQILFVGLLFMIIIFFSVLAIFKSLCVY